MSAISQKQVMADEAALRRQSKDRLESRIAELLAKGLTATEVAARLGAGRGLVCGAAKRLGVKPGRVENANCNPPEAATAIPYGGQTQANRPMDWWDA